MKFNTSNLQWGIADKSDRLIAAFDDQSAATQFHSTLKDSPQYSGKGLQVVNVQTGQPIGAGLETSGDRVG